MPLGWRSWHLLPSTPTYAEDRPTYSGDREEQHLRRYDRGHSALYGYKNVGSDHVLQIPQAEQKMKPEVDKVELCVRQRFMN